MPDRKFYIEYYINYTLQSIPIRRWEDEHRGIFSEYAFTNSQPDFPTKNYIAKRLERQNGFVRKDLNGEVVLRNNNAVFRF
jgi:hypothetical protein